MANKPSAAAFLSDVQEPQAEPSIAGPSASAFLKDLPDTPTTQQAGPVLDPVLLAKRLKPKKEDLPELIMSALAGIKFSASKTLPGALAVGGASMVGEAGRQLGERAGVFESKPPDTSGEALKRIFMAGGRGVVGETVGRGVGRVLFGPFKGGVTPEIAAQVKAAESVGVKPPLSAMTESKTVQALERFAEVSPFGSMITKQKKAALQGLEEYARTVGENIGVDRPPEVTGNLAKESLRAFKETYDATKDKLYGAVLPQLKNTPIEAKNTVAALEEVIERRSGTGEPEGLKKVREWLAALKGSQPQKKVIRKGEPSMAIPDVVQEIPGKAGSIGTFGDLRKFRTNVGQRGKFNDPAVAGLNADLSQIYAAASRDLDAAASKVSPDIAEGLAKADEFFQQGKSTLKSKVFKAIGSVNPENVHKVVIVPNSPSQLQIGKELLGEETFKDVERQWFDSILRNSTITKEGETVVSPLKLATNLRKYGGTIGEMFKDRPELATQMAKLQDISTLLTRGKGITEGSQTAYLAQLLAPVMTAFYSPQAALGVLGFLGLQGVGTKALTSDIGRKVLTTGLPQAEKFASRMAQVGGQIGMQKQ